MSAISINNNDDKIFISLDKNTFSESFVTNLLNRLRAEELAKELDIKEGIEDLGDEIKLEWWNRNKYKVINE